MHLLSNLRGRSLRVVGDQIVSAVHEAEIQARQLSTSLWVASILSDFDSGAVNPTTGCALVEPTLQVKLTSGARNIYAVGDIVDWNEQKVHVSSAYTRIGPLVNASNL